MCKFAPLPLFALSAPLALSLAACSKAPTDEADSEDKSVSINIGGDSDDASVSESGKDSASLSIDADGFKMDIEIPDIEIDTGNDADDTLYPGSKITGMNVDANSKNGNDNADVELRFISPASPDAVAEHMAERIRKEGGKASVSGNSITGTTDDGNPFTVTLEGSGNETKGVMNIDA